MSSPAVMAIVNATPDSFFPDSRVDGVARAVERGHDYLALGASILDVGGESTRPGADPVAVETELDRVIPIVEQLSKVGRVSIDTRNELVAREAVAAGATMINDISSSLHEVAAELGVAWVATHMQGTPQTMQAEPAYDDVVVEVLNFLNERSDTAVAAGVPEVWIDPGIGFGKSVEHNVALVANIDRFVASGKPVVLGVSRKSVVGYLHAFSDNPDVENPKPLPVEDRLVGSLAMATWGFAQGVAMVRAHDVEATIRAAKVVTA